MSIAAWKVGLFLILCYIIVGTIDHAAARASHLMLLENSALPVSGDECERAAPSRGRPDWTVSKQQRTGDPYHHRFCAWNG